MILNDNDSALASAGLHLPTAKRSYLLCIDGPSNFWIPLGCSERERGWRGHKRRVGRHRRRSSTRFLWGGGSLAVTDNFVSCGSVTHFLASFILRGKRRTEQKTRRHFILAVVLQLMSLSLLLSISKAVGWVRIPTKRQSKVDWNKLCSGRYGDARYFLVEFCRLFYNTMLQTVRCR